MEPIPSTSIYTKPDYTILYTKPAYTKPVYTILLSYYYGCSYRDDKIYIIVLFSKKPNHPTLIPLY